MDIKNYREAFCSQRSSSVLSLSHGQLFVTAWTAARQASLSITNPRSLLKLMSIALVMPYDHLTLCHPLLFPPSIFPSISIFSNESVFHIRRPKYWSFSFRCKFCPTFFPSSFIISDFTFRSLIHFELVFVQGVR